jgi:hypothetical protein
VLVRAAGGRTAALGLRYATWPGCRIRLGGWVPAGPMWPSASELGYEGGLFAGASRDKKWARIKAARLRY